MDAKQIEALTESCRALAGRASADEVTAGDLAMLRDADDCARKLAGAGRAGAAELRAATDEAVAVLARHPDGPIHSRLDSHHWDLGFLRVESGFDVVAVVDGDVLCWNEDEEKELHLIGRDEVRVDFGDGLPG